VIVAVTTESSASPPRRRNAAMALPALSYGTTSQYPTVVTVWSAHHNPSHTVGKV
jgi:hypothetical protein